MPMNDYICESCGHVVNDHLTLSHNSVVKCEICGETMKIVPTFKSSFVVNGKHTYKTGYNG